MAQLLARIGGAPAHETRASGLRPRSFPPVYKMKGTGNRTHIGYLPSSAMTAMTVTGHDTLSNQRTSVPRMVGKEGFEPPLARFQSEVEKPGFHTSR